MTRPARGVFVLDGPLVERGFIVQHDGRLTPVFADRLVGFAWGYFCRKNRPYKASYVHVLLSNKRPLAGDGDRRAAGFFVAYPSPSVIFTDDGRRFPCRVTIAAALWGGRLPGRGYTDEMRARWRVVYWLTTLVHEMQHLVDARAGRRFRHNLPHAKRSHEIRAKLSETKFLMAVLSNPRMRREFEWLVRRFKKEAIWAK